MLTFREVKSHDNTLWLRKTFTVLASASTCRAIAGATEHAEVRHLAIAGLGRLVDELLGRLAHLLYEDHNLLQVVVRALLLLVELADPADNLVLLPPLLVLLRGQRLLVPLKPIGILHKNKQQNK